MNSFCNIVATNCYIVATSRASETSDFLCFTVAKNRGGYSYNYTQNDRNFKHFLCLTS
jgi:hypothetical protein